MLKKRIGFGTSKRFIALIFLSCLLTSGATVETDVIENGIDMRVSRNRRKGEVVSRMVPAHGPVLEAEMGGSMGIATSYGQ